MLTKNEITALNLSPTKKDFVQIWNELLDVASRLSERWDPTSTNESDPGIVILKALAGIADKLNYNIDKNTLEAFMPTAAQEDSMRKLTEMLGYNMKYYRSAETEVTIKYHSTSEEEDEILAGSLLIPKFTVITNSDGDITYFTTNQKARYISKTSPKTDPPIPCMEGQIVKCESLSDNKVITAAQISENNRFYLPETRIAENGIFVYNVASIIESDNTATLADGTPWEKVDNLNVNARGSRVFKFGYDSYANRPYIEFPEDYSELINDGLFIYYARTSGASGNISPRTLTQLELPSGWSGVSAESFSVENTFAATTGSNIETIKQAYNNFKKTVGTFETLVTCRDYMNKIYTMTNDIGKPYVSNILATDIRTDLNRAVTICSCDDAGIFYKETPLTETVIKTFKRSGSNETVDVETTEPLISHFDLVLYPFKAYTKINNNVKDIQAAYEASFKYDAESFAEIKAALNEGNIKAIAHNIVAPREGDVVSINNYLRISAIIGTNSKVSIEEGELLKEKIKITLANAFSMRELDFGEEIPFESLVETIENSDSRIKVASLNEPAVYTTFSVYEGKDTYGNPILKEYSVASDWFTETEADATGRFDIQKDTDGNYTAGTFNTKRAKEIYNKLVLRNILAGRVSLFKYNNAFTTSFSEGAYATTTEVSAEALSEDLRENLNTTKDNPFIAYADGEAVYTAQRTKLDDEPESLKGKGTPTSSDNPIKVIGSDGALYTSEYNEEDPENPIYSKTNFAKAAVPEAYANSLITKNPSDDNNITEITSRCEILPDPPASEGDKGSQISEVLLSTGEFIKFRAPNFTTIKTYPAYINYHLILNKDRISEAKNAEAYNLATLLTTEDQWETLIKYFRSINKTQTVTLTQQILKAAEANAENTGLIIENAEDKDSPENVIKNILAKSGRILLCNGGEPTVSWLDSSKTGKPVLSENVKTKLTIGFDDGSNFLKSSDTVGNIQNKVNAALANSEINDAITNITEDGDWTISYTFEYIPLEASTLEAWAEFITAKGKDLFGYEPIVENKSVFWRAFGEGYQTNKYILTTGAKLLPFTTADFGFLGNFSSYLNGIYVAKTLGQDQKANFVSNNEEYKLRDQEYLYIEYTPSSTTEDGTLQTGESTKEIHGPGSIIRPAGFDGGLKDSTAYQQEGHTPFKEVTFNETTKLGMYSLGANEQIELRDYARVILDKDFLESSPTIYVYKNFNDCPELETASYDKNGQRINNSYTLKDGEYIFYTNSDKAEFAYFSSGTEVTLTGKVVLQEFSIIDFSIIFDSGVEEIPWKPITFSGKDSIIFQEYQYITLGSGDKLESLTLFEPEKSITEDWQYCDKVYYLPAGDEEPTPLSKINIVESSSVGTGWEVASFLELNVSPNNMQTLRTTDKIKTSIVLHKAPASGVINPDKDFELAATDAKHPLSFKTNLICQDNSTKADIASLYYNPDNLKSFELKVFSESAPAAVVTKAGTTIPSNTEDVDLTTWPTNTLFITKSSDGLWNQVSLAKLAEAEDGCENAIKLAVSLIPDTYGIFSIYIKYDNIAVEPETWIELHPGKTQNTLTLLNASAEWGTPTAAGNNKLKLNPGLNCIRVNNTSDLFIKTSQNSSGMLCFDELRLVDASKIKNSNGDEFATSGLNLEQLGYLYIPGSDDENTADTFNIFDKKVRQSLKTEYTEEALEALADEKKSLDVMISSDWEAAKATLPKLEKLVSFIETAKAELAVAKDRDDLINTYIGLVEELEAEEALKTALNSAENTSKLEQQLLDLLSTYTNDESAKQEVLNKLEALRTSAMSAAEKFGSLAKEYIFDDYKNISVQNKEATTINPLGITGDPTAMSLDKFEFILGEPIYVTSPSVDANDADNDDWIGIWQDPNAYQSIKWHYITTENSGKPVDVTQGESLAVGDYYIKCVHNATDHNSGTKAIAHIRIIEAPKMTAIVPTTLQTDLKAASLARVNTQYTEQLNSITEKINSIINSEDYAKVLESLDKLYAEKHTELLNQIQLLLSDNQKELLDAVNNAYIISLGEQNAESGEYEVDYDTLAAQLTAIREQLESSDLTDLMAKINLAAGEKAYPELQQLINQLSGIPSVNEDITEQIDLILETIQEKTSTKTDTDIIGAIEALRDDVELKRNDQIQAILGDVADPAIGSIRALLTELASAYTTTVEDLKASQDEQIQELAIQLEQAATNRRTLAEAISTFTDMSTIFQNDCTLPFAKEALLEVWPAYMKKDLLEGVDILYSNIYDLLKGTIAVTDFEVPSNFTNADGTNRSLLIKAANMDSFGGLYEQAATIVQKASQKTGREALISYISSEIPSFNVSTDNLNTERNAVITALAAKLSTASLSERQSLVKALSAELDTEIQLDTQLIKICAKLLCPSILVFEESLLEAANDSFYEKVANLVAEKKAAFEAGETTLAAIAGALNDSPYAELKAALETDNIIEFAVAFEPISSLLNNSLVPTDFIQMLEALCDNFEHQTQLTIIKDSKLLKILQQEGFRAAWEDKDGYWMDSAGNYFQKYITIDGESNWYTYQQYTTNEELAEAGVSVWENEDGWMTSEGESVVVTLKRSNSTSRWLVPDTGEEFSIKTDEGAWLVESDDYPDCTTISLYDKADDILNTLLDKVSVLGQATIPPAFKEAYDTYLLETQLLADIQAIDVNREFYYNVPIEANVAIDFTESEAKLNSLMNPFINYDINNINNNFVISKLDINYLTKGIQIARSSRLN